MEGALSSTAVYVVSSHPARSVVALAAAFSMPLSPAFHPAGPPHWFTRRPSSEPTPAQARGWAEILAGPRHAHRRAHRLGQDARGVPREHRRARRAARRAKERRPHRGPLRLAAQGAEQRRAAQPRRAARGHPPRPRASSAFLRPPFASALRTGDTTPAARAAILRNVPHILITTPESLYLMLTAERSRALFAGVRTVIVDEVHALMRDKRGSHLALSLARLDAVAEAAAAAHRPLGHGAPDRRGGALPGRREGAPVLRGRRRAPARSRSRHRGAGDGSAGRGDARAVERDLRPPRGARRASTARRSSSSTRAGWPSASRTTSASASARTASAPTTGASPRSAACASSSASRRARCARSPPPRPSSSASTSARSTSCARSARRARSRPSCSASADRATRSGARRAGASSRRRATSSSSARRSSAPSRRGGSIAFEPPRAPLDVLAQQIVAECAAREWTEDALFEQFRQAAPYAQLERARRSTRSSRACPRARRRASAGAAALLHRDRVNGSLRGRRAARIVALTNGGAIPDLADYRVVLDPDETLVGTVNEDWAIESMAGDVFVLGSHSWRIRRVESRVGRAPGGGRAGPAAFDSVLARRGAVAYVGALGRGEPASSGHRRAHRRAGARGAQEWLARRVRACRRRARPSSPRICPAQRDALGVVPDDGRRRLRALLRRGGRHAARRARAVRRPREPRLRPRAAQALLRLVRLRAPGRRDRRRDRPLDGHDPELPALGRVPLRARPTSSTRRCEQAILAAPMFGTRWRWNASRALAVLRSERGKKVPPFLQRMRADDLLAAVFPAQVGLPGERARADRDPRSPARARRRSATASTRRWTPTGCAACSSGWSAARSACTRATRPSPRRSRTRSSTPSRTRSSTTRRSRSAARARCRSRRTLPDHQRDLGVARSGRHRARRGRGATRAARRRRAARRAARPGRRAASKTHGPRGSRSSSRRPGARVGGAPRWRSPPSARAPSRRSTRDAPRVALPAAPRRPAASPRGRGARGRARTRRGRGSVHGGAPRGAPRARRVGGRFGGGAARERRAACCGVGSLAERRGADASCLRSAPPRADPPAHDGPAARGDRARERAGPAPLPVRAPSPRFARARGREARGLARRDRDARRASRSARRPGRRTSSPRASRATAPTGSTSCASRAKSRGGACRRGARRRRADRVDFASDAHRARAAARSRLAPRGRAGRGRRRAADIRGIDGHARGACAGAARSSSTTSRRRARSRARSSPRALWDLVGRGLVTGDGFQPLRELMARGRTSLPRRGEPAAARRAGGRSFERQRGRGRASPDEIADHVAEQLLARYGVVFREIAARESFAVPWRDVRARAPRFARREDSCAGAASWRASSASSTRCPRRSKALRRIRRTAREGETVRISAGRPAEPRGHRDAGPARPVEPGRSVARLRGRGARRRADDRSHQEPRIG